MDYLINNIWKYTIDALTGAGEYRTFSMMIGLFVLLILIMPGCRVTDRILTGGLMIYLYLIFSMCVLVRGTWQVENTSVVLIPFWQLRVILDGTRPDMKMYAVENVILYIPAGIFLGILNRHSFFQKKAVRAFLVSVIYCAVFSAAIECTQYFLQVGACETDDVICNTLGGICGYLPVWLICCRRRV